MMPVSKVNHQIYFLISLMLKLKFVHSSFCVDKNAECVGLLNRANSISEWIWPLAGKLVVLYSGSNIAVSIASAIYCWSIYGQMKSDRVFHSMNVMLVKIFKFFNLSRESLLHLK